VVFNQDDEGICVEPMTAPPDAQNLSIQGESYIECLITFNEDF
jgi:aldose 1-epimerase